MGWSFPEPTAVFQHVVSAFCTGKALRPFAQSRARSQIWEAKKSSDPSFIWKITLKPSQKGPLKLPFLGKKSDWAIHPRAPSGLCQWGLILMVTMPAGAGSDHQIPCLRNEEALCSVITGM